MDMMYIWIDDVYTIDGQNCMKIIVFIINIVAILFIGIDVG